MALPFGSQSMVTPLRTVIVKSPEQAFRSPQAIEHEWRALGFLRPPDFDNAVAEHAGLVSLLKEAGATVLHLPEDPRTTIDSLYAHDPVLTTDRGAIILQTGKPERRGEGPAVADALKLWGIPILGEVRGEGTGEGGDLLWLDSHTLAAGRGFRTNQAGIAQLAQILAPLEVDVIPVPLPYANGPRDVLHLMSFISMVDDDLAVVYRPLLPVPFYELLAERGIQLIDVPEGEYPMMGCNVLAVAPRQLIMVEGSPITRARLEAAGCVVSEFSGHDICFAGSGGPTCLTRPLLRE
jgi:N-dimethylarginine dimethylaminohydrolase